MEMAQAPTISTAGETKVIDEYMDEKVLVTDYAAAKSQVKQSFLGRMVGPAWAAGALGAAAMVAWALPAGAAPSFLADEGLNPSVINSAHHAFPTVQQYFVELGRNAVAAGLVASAIPAYAHHNKLQQDEQKEQKAVQEA